MDNILNNSNISYHWIGNNIFKMIGILEDGILSRWCADNYRINLDRNFIGHNKTDYVSLCESPIIHDTFDHGAFNLYTKTGICFVINTENYNVFSNDEDKEHKGFTNSQIPGEAYVRYLIRKEDIIGIMIPQEMLKKPISEVILGLEQIGKGLVDKTVLSFIKKLKKHFDYEVDSDRLNDFLKKRKN